MNKLVINYVEHFNTAQLLNHIVTLILFVSFAVWFARLYTAIGKGKSLPSAQRTHRNQHVPGTWSSS